ncbi:MAG: UDP-N-acetylmuramate dehydrogenase [Bacteroidota bacterium]
MKEPEINRSLKHLNSFGLEVKTARFSEPGTEEELSDFFKRHYQGEPLLIVGEGSNTLFTKDYEGTVLHPDIRGFEVLNESGDEVLVRAGAGENWDSFVERAVEQTWYGAENLSLIPGSVGSVPVQNIGAYGVEAAEIIHSVEYYNPAEDRFGSIASEDCRFGYRSSFFKSEEGNRLIITRVIFRLGKKEKYVLDYGDVRKRFEGLTVRNLKSLRETIISIRREKLPDPAVTGNAGSFFKNPVIPALHYQRLLADWPGIPGYHQSDGSVKVPAAWLIQQCGWKGYRKGDAGCWPSQPLVLVNYGQASGKALLELSLEIAESVNRQFDIALEREVRVV